MFLAGPYDLTKEPQLREMYSEQDVLLFGKEADIPFDFAQDTFSDLLKRLPKNKPVDFMFFALPEFFGVPREIEHSPFPVIAIISDWSINLEALTRVLPFFSHFIVDLPGLSTFKRLGFENVDTIPLYGFTPSIHRLIPGISKQYDVTMIGNLNDVVHEKRTLYLKRLALLNRKYKIRLFNGVFGEEYAKIVNASKITFNHSIRGEMNMRCYEALACGSLLFLEEENLEAKLFLKDREHCVYYNDGNFESLVDYYLSHDAERETIAENGRLFIQDYSYIKQTRRLMSKVNEIGIDNIAKKAPTAASWSESKKARHRFFQAIHASETSRFEVARQNLEIMNREEPNFYFLVGFASLEFTDSLQDADRSNQLELAVQNLETAVRQEPDFAPTYFSLGRAFLKLGRYEKALQQFWIALALAQAWGEKYREFGHLINPIAYDAWHIEKEREFRNPSRDPGDFFRSKCLESLAETFLQKEDLQGAVSLFQKAVELRLNEALLWRKLGAVLERLHRIPEAREAYEHALAKRPFYVELWTLLPRLYNTLGEKKSLTHFCQEILFLIEALPSLSDLRPEIENWLALVQIG